MLLAGRGHFIISIRSDAPLVSPQRGRERERTLMNSRSGQGYTGRNSVKSLSQIRQNKKGNDLN